jgi:hypothetical protein
LLCEGGFGGRGVVVRLKGIWYCALRADQKRKGPASPVDIILVNGRRCRTDMGTVRKRFT